MKKSLLLLILGARISLAACGGGGHGGGGLLPGPGGSPSAPPTVAPTQAPASAGTVYVGGEISGNYTVAAFDANGNPKSLSGGFPGLTEYPYVKYDAADSLLYTPNAVSGKRFAQRPAVRAELFPTGVYDAGLRQERKPAIAGARRVDGIALAGIQVWNESGSLVTPAGGFSNLPTASDVTVQGIAYDSHNDNLCVGGSNSTILTYDESGNLKLQGAWNGAFLPGRMAFNPDNNEIYILEETGPFNVTRRHALQRGLPALRVSPRRKAAPRRSHRTTPDIGRRCDRQRCRCERRA